MTEGNGSSGGNNRTGEVMRMVRERIERKTIIDSATVPELLDALGLPRNADIVHIFDVFIIHPEYCRNCKLNYGKFVNLGTASEVRENIDRFGVIHPIIVSKGNGRLWVIDGGTRLEVIKASERLSFTVIDVNPDAGETEALIGLIIAVSTMLNKFSEVAVNQVINLIKPFLDKHGVDPSALIGTVSMPSGVEASSFVGMLKDVRDSVVLGEYPDCIKTTALNYIDSLLNAMGSKQLMPIRLIRMLKATGSPERVLLNTILAVASESCCYRKFTELAHDLRIYRELKDVLTRVGFRVDYVATVNACREAITRLFTEQFGRDDGLKYAPVAVKLFDFIRSLPGSKRGQSPITHASVSAYLAVDKVLRGVLPKYIEQKTIAEAFGVTPVGLRIELSRIASLSEVQEMIEKLRSELNGA